MMGASFSEAVTSPANPPSPAAHKNRNGSETSFNARDSTKTRTAGVISNPSTLNQEQTVSLSHSCNASEQSGRVSEKKDEQPCSTSTGAGSTSDPSETRRVSHASKDLAGSASKFKTKLKGIFSKKSSKTLYSDAHNKATSTTVDVPPKPKHTPSPTAYFDNWSLSHTGMPCSPRPEASSSNIKKNDVPDRARYHAKSQLLGDSANLQSTIAMSPGSMERARRPSNLMLAPRRANPPQSQAQVNAALSSTPFWEDPRPPKPLHVGKKYDKPVTNSAWALRNHLSYKFNPELGRTEPKWKTGPNLSQVKAVACTQLLTMGFPFYLDYEFEASLCSEDAWMRKYLIKGVNTKNGRTCKWFLCVVLPKFPGYKIRSLVATMAYVNLHTNLPVPKVLAMDLNLQNPLKMEYFMMEAPQGKTYASIEHELSFEAKKTFARSVADCVDQLSHLAFSNIGSLYHDEKRTYEDCNAYYVGTITEPHTTREMRVDYKIERGPYQSLAEFYRAQIEVVRLEALDPRQEERLELWFPPPNRPHPEDDVERDQYVRRMVLKQINIPLNYPFPEEDGLWEFLPPPTYTYEDRKLLPAICSALQDVLPLIASSKELDPGATRVFHFNLSKHNVLVKNSGEVVGILGWENAWVAPPELLQKYPPCIPDLNEENPDPYLDYVSDHGDDENKDNWKDMELGMEYEDRLRELGSPHLDVLQLQRSSKVVRMERLLRKPPSINTFMDYLDSVDRQEEVAHYDGSQDAEDETWI